MMQRTKIVAEDSREAMTKVMKECGEDAVILSTRKVPGGVEIIAGHEPKRSMFHSLGSRQNFNMDMEDDEEETEIVERSEASKAPAQSAKTFQQVLAESGRAADLLKPSPFQFRPAPPEPVIAKADVEKSKSEQIQTSRLDAIENSVREIRAMLGSEMMLSGLKTAGASPALISVFLAQSGALGSVDPDRRFAKFLADRMVHKAPPQLTGGPRVVLTLGPSGSGKTTLLAQLAARARMAAPDEKLSFVNADASRFGAAEQLRAYGRILDVPVIDVEHPSDLSKLIKNSGQRLSLFIDMPSQPHENSVVLDILERSRDEMSQMISVGAIASNLSTDAIDRILTRYPNLDALALTKLDEAPLSLSTFSLLSLRGPGIAYLASTSHLVKGLMEPDSEMLESVIHASLVGSDAEQLN
jgi:flagellar biosynthesis protein FlhF